MTAVVKLGSLDMRDSTSQWVLREGFDPGSPNAQNALNGASMPGRRVMTWSLRMRANTADGVTKLIAGIQDQLRAAELAARPNSGREPVTVELQLGSNTVYYDLLPDVNGHCGYLTLGPTGMSAIEQGIVRAAILTLNCSLYGRGDRLVATNLALNSADPSAASYTATNLSATANAIIAPNGDAAGATLFETTTNGQHSLVQEFTKAASDITYVLAVYGRPHGRDIFDLTIQDTGGSNGVVASYNASTGALNFGDTAFGTGFTAVDSGIIAKPHDYYRGWIAVTVPASVTTFQAVLNLRSDADTASYAGDTAKGIDWWGLTLQANATQPGPYLETGDSLTLVNGTDQGPYLYDLPGDVAGLVRLTVSDVSTNSKVIQEIHIGAAPVDFAGDYAGIQTITPADDASFVDSDSVTGTVAQGFASQVPTRIGTITKPADAPYTDGRLKVLARVKDGSSGMGAPSNVTATLGAIRSGIQQWQKSGTGSSIAGTFDKAPISGNLLRSTVALHDDSTTITTPSGWTAVTGTLNDVTAIGRIEEFYKVSDGTEVGVTFAFSGSTGYAVAGEEVAGLATSSPNDVSATQPLGSINDVTGTTSATAQANEYAVGAINFRTTPDPNDNHTPQNGFTVFQSPGIPSGGQLYVMHKTLTSTGTQSTGIILAVQRTSVAYITTYKGLTSAAPAMPAGSYQIVIAAVDADGTVGLASQPVTIAVPVTGAIALTWDAPTFGPDVDHYRVYWQRLGVWNYFDTNDATAQYILSTESSPDGTTAPVFGSSAFGEYRLPNGLKSGTLLHESLFVPTLIANDIYELLDMGVMTATTQPNRWGEDALGWQWGVDIIHDSLSPPMVFDSTWLLPANLAIVYWAYHANSVTASPPSTNRDWVYDLRPDLDASCVLYETGTSTEAGSFDCSGRMQFGPGAVQLVIAVVVTDGVCDVTDAKFQIGLEYVPLYVYLAS